MIRIEAVPEVPSEVVANLTANSREEWKRVADETRTGAMWAFYDEAMPLAFAQVDRKGLLGSAEFRFLMCEGWTFKHTRVCREYTKMLCIRSGGLITAINCDFQRGRRFAEYCGFKRTSLSALDFDIYEMRV